jgi:hypothetical protein
MISRSKLESVINFEPKLYLLLSSNSALYREATSFFLLCSSLPASLSGRHCAILKLVSKSSLLGANEF